MRQSNEKEGYNVLKVSKLMSVQVVIQYSNKTTGLLLVLSVIRIFDINNVISVIIATMNIS